MAPKLITLRDLARELAIMLAYTILGLAALSCAAVLIGTMPAFLALAIGGLR